MHVAAALSIIITAAIRPMPPCVTAFESGHATMITMVSARSTATPVREREPHFGPPCGPSGVSTSSTCTCMVPPMKPWSMRNE
jgi:hypothetical protein